MAIINKPKEGEVYLLAMDDGRFSIGVLARVETSKPRKPYGIFVYFFGPFDSPPKGPFLASVLIVKSAAARLLTSASGIYCGQWIKLGDIVSWERKDWELPRFYLEDFENGRISLVELDEANLAYPIRNEVVDSKEGLEPNISYGSEAARHFVSSLLEKKTALPIA